MVVIIGAGPAGLCAGIMLRQAGANVVIYDLRAGIYTRPGHLSENVFKKAEETIGVKFWRGGVGHIKELERHLYTAALHAGVRIEKKHFKKLHPHETEPGIVIVDEDGREETVPAQYVLDCTGSRRDVVHAVNSIAPDSTLKITTFADVPVPTHLLAYIKMDTRQLDEFHKALETGEPFPVAMPALSFAHSIFELRALGWNELEFPRCYGIDFGKGKICLYLQAPPNLLKENYDHWIKTVMASYSIPGTYEHLSPSINYDTKPRLTAFTIKAKMLEKVSYTGIGLPTVIALGDAQINADYRLAHGIGNGLERLKALLHNLTITDGAISSFNPAQYQADIKDSLDSHKGAIIAEVKKQHICFSQALQPAKLKLYKALESAPTAAEREAINGILLEIEARQSSIKARRIIVEYEEKPHNVLSDIIRVRDFLILEDAQIHLLLALRYLPAYRETERKKTILALVQLAYHWKIMGHQLITSAQSPEAVNAYNKALEIYESFSESPNPLSLEKILYPLIQALHAQAFSLLLCGKNDETLVLQLQMKNLFTKYNTYLSAQVYSGIQILVDEITKFVTPIPEDPLHSRVKKRVSPKPELADDDDRIDAPRLLSSMELTGPAGTGLADCSRLPSYPPKTELLQSVGLFKTPEVTNPRREIPYTVKKTCTML